MLAKFTRLVSQKKELQGLRTENGEYRAYSCTFNEMWFWVWNRVMGEGMLISVKKVQDISNKYSKFGYETITAELVNYECNQFFIILYLLRYQSWDACVLISLVSHFWLKTNSNAIRMAWCGFSKKSWSRGADV